MFGAKPIFIVHKNQQIQLTRFQLLSKYTYDKADKWQNLIDFF
jgi:hypothetical protein